MVHILLVSRDTHITELIRSCGYDPIIADSEEDILEAESKAGLIIIDTSKPTINKRKAINLVKKSNLPIILVTEPLEERTTQGIKVAAHLKKPIDPQQFINVVKTGLFKYKMERLFLDNEQIYQHIINTSLEGICIFDNSGNILYCNKQLGKFLECQPSELIGKNILEIVHPNDKVIVERILNLCRKGMQGKQEIRFIKNNGKPCWLLFSGTPIIEDSAFKGGFCMFTDITGQKILEEELIRTTKFLTLLNKVNNSIIKSRNIEEMIQRVCNILAEYRPYKYIGVLDKDHKPIHEIGERPAKFENILKLRVKDKLWGLLGIKGNLEPEELAILEEIASTLSFTIEKMLAENKLRENELEYRELFESAGDALFIMKKNTIITCNKKALKLFQAKPKDIIGKHPWELSPKYQEGGEKSEIKAKKLIRETIREGERQFMWIHKKKTGEPFYAHVSLTYHPHRGQIIAAIRDITGQVEMEKLLKAEHRKFKDLINSLPDAIFAVDKKGRIIAWNKEIEKMTGTPAEEMLGRGGHAYSIPFYGKPRPALLDLLFQDLPEIEKFYENVRREGHNIYGEIYLPNIYNGRGGHLQLKVSPLYDEKGDITGAIEIIRDITPLKITERKLRAELMVTSTISRLYPVIVSPKATKKKLANKILTELLKITGSSGGFITFKGEILASKGKCKNPESTPISIGDEIIGHISLEKDKGFNKFDIKVIKRFVEYFGLAIHRIEYEKRLIKHQAKLNILNKVLKASKTDKIENFLTSILDIIIDDLKFESGSIIVNGKIIYKRGSIIPKKEIPEHTILKKEGGKKVLMIPLKFQGDIFGVIEAYTSNKTPKMEFIRLFADEINEAISKIITQMNLQQSLHEKEALLKEVHHRVKNNLQVISSLLSLQAKYCGNEEVKNILADSQARIKSLALVHEKLYKTENITNINSKDYLESLARDLINFQAPRPIKIRLETDIDDIPLEMDKCIPLGLITNELVMNSLKHAFPEKEGIITVKFKCQENKCNLEISDNGKGLPEDFDIERLSSLGLQIVLGLVRQLDGELKIESDGGTSFIMDFPL
ncbi:MAG: PAS domain S-box protein [Methanothermobacter sp.]